MKELTNKEVKLIVTLVASKLNFYSKIPDMSQDRINELLQLLSKLETSKDKKE